MLHCMSAWTCDQDILKAEMCPVLQLWQIKTNPVKHWLPFKSSTDAESIVAIMLLMCYHYLLSCFQCTHLCTGQNSRAVLVYRCYVQHGSIIPDVILHINVIITWMVTPTINHSWPTYCATYKDGLRQPKLRCEWPRSLEHFASRIMVAWQLLCMR